LVKDYKIYLKFPYDSHTKRRFLPYTELTGWCL